MKVRHFRPGRRYTTTYACKQRIVALLLMELLSKMWKMQTISSHVSARANLCPWGASARANYIPHAAN